MALQSSGPISLNDIHVEAGGGSGTTATINDSDIRGLIGKGSGVQMSFSEWYGASATVTLISGNSSYQAPAYMSPESRRIATLWPHTAYIVNGPSPLATGSTFTLNGRSTYATDFGYFASSGQFQIVMADLSGGQRSSYGGYPANSGWSSITLSGNGSSATYYRSSASYTGQATSLYLNGSSYQTYGGARWTWSSGSNIFPASHNTTSFSLTIA